jgi:hypothetical protein
MIFHSVLLSLLFHAKGESAWTIDVRYMHCVISLNKDTDHELSEWVKRCLILGSHAIPALLLTPRNDFA